MTKKMDKHKFNKLIQGIKSNDKTEAEVCMTILFKSYFSFIVEYIGMEYKSKHLGEDVAQDFFVKLIHTEFKSEIENPNAWICTVCKNIAKGIFAKEQHYQAAYKETENETGDEMFENVIVAEYMEKLKKADPDAYKIIIMVEYEGYSYKEIAESMGLKYGTVKQKYNRGIKKLKEF